MKHSKWLSPQMLRDFMLWEVGRYEREINLSAMKYARRAYSISFILMRNRFAQSSRLQARSASPDREIRVAP